MNYHSHVIIAGGGLAGLSAAVALTQAGVKVTLLESRPRAGGRASSFLDKPTGDEIDNCQHVALGCCTNYLYFLNLIQSEIDRSGKSGRVYTREKDYTFVDEKGKHYSLRSDHAAAPLHLVRSFLGLGYLSIRDRLTIARGLVQLAGMKITTENDRPFSQWLLDSRQSAESIRLFWEVVLVSALSESLNRISLKYARKVFIDTFMTNRQGMELIIPQIPLSRLYGECVTGLIEKQGGEVRLSCGVGEIIYDENQNRVSGIKTRQGEVITGSHVLSALPWFNLDQACSPLLLQKLNFQRTHWEEAPITSVHFWVDKPAIPLKHGVLLGRLSHWIFHREEPSEKEHGHYYQVVISQSRDLSEWSQQQIIDDVLNELSSIWQEFRNVKIIRSRVITEHKAVFSPFPGIDQIRPKQQTSVNGFFLAGDWTQTNWPATMEGAVRSGFIAAEEISKSIGMNQKFLQPDLATSIFSKMLIR